MTNEELQAHINAIRDELDAGTVECYAGKPVGWVTDVACRTMLIDSTVGAAPMYRIKPKPREVFLHNRDIPAPNVCNTGTSIVGTQFFPSGTDDLIKFREVLE